MTGGKSHTQDDYDPDNSQPVPHQDSGSEGYLCHAVYGVSDARDSCRRLADDVPLQRVYGRAYHVLDDLHSDHNCYTGPHDPFHYGPHKLCHFGEEILTVQKVYKLKQHVYMDTRQNTF